MRALVVDDHPLIQEAVINVLRRLEPEADIAVAGDFERGLEIALQGVEPDIVLLDLHLPGLSGIPALKAWRARFPSVPVAILSAVRDQPTVLAAIGAGASAFIPKTSSNDVMLNALRLVLAGGRYLPPEILSPSGRRGAPQRMRRAGTPSAETLGLTERQAEILRLIAKGASNKRICAELGLAEGTVKAHVTALLRALNVSSRTEAAIEATKLGLGEPRTRSERGR